MQQTLNTIHLDKGYRRAEVCELLGIKSSTFWKMVKEKRLRTVKISERVTVVRGREILRVLSGEERGENQ